MKVKDEHENEQQPMDRDARKWTWWPTWYELRTHYFKEVGFLACLSQMIGATVFVSLFRYGLSSDLTRLLVELDARRKFCWNIVCKSLNEADCLDESYTLHASSCFRL